MASLSDNRIANALSAWDAWNHQGFIKRSERLQKIHTQIPQANDVRSVGLLKHLLEQAATLEQITTLPGPTGESNELYLNGRGICLVSADQTSTYTAFLGQAFAALVAGNAVLLHWPEEQAWCEKLARLLHQAGVPEAILQAVSDLSLDQALGLDHLAVIACVLPMNRVIEINALIAKRSGLLVQVVAETDPVQCTALLQPDHLSRFVTERTRTINTTAVGGNATLLELGSSAV